MATATRYDVARAAAVDAAAEALAACLPRYEHADLRAEIAVSIADVLMHIRADRGLAWLRGMAATHRQIATISDHQALAQASLMVATNRLAVVIGVAAAAIVATLGRKKAEVE